jgi:hypothetical protein
MPIADEAAAKKIIVESLEKKKGKTKFYLKDFYKFLPDEKLKGPASSMRQMGKTSSRPF